jgi:hypothetical protein
MKKLHKRLVLLFIVIIAISILLPVSYKFGKYLADKSNQMALQQKSCAQEKLLYALVKVCGANSKYEYQAITECLQKVAALGNITNLKAVTKDGVPGWSIGSNIAPLGVDNKEDVEVTFEMELDKDKTKPQPKIKYQCTDDI